MTPAASNNSTGNGEDTRALGDYLKDARSAMHLTLRDVEAKTDKAVTNGYLSQIENNVIKQPSPNVLYNLAGLYGLDYRDLLERAGHHAPTSTGSVQGIDDEVLAGLPLRAIAELNAQERQELTEYIAFMRQKRKRRESGT
jgi:transcriptional regulator with XRE-family HTH domain